MPSIISQTQLDSPDSSTLQDSSGDNNLKGANDNLTVPEDWSGIQDTHSGLWCGWQMPQQTVLGLLVFPFMEENCQEVKGGKSYFSFSKHQMTFLWQRLPTSITLLICNMLRPMADVADPTSDLLAKRLHQPAPPPMPLAPVHWLPHCLSILLQ